MREISAARYYELMVITTPEGTPEELVETVDQIGGYITGAGGTIIRSNYDSPWGRRRLAYSIRHESQDVRDGFYTLIHLQLEPQSVAAIERDLKLNDKLMRYLVLQLPGEPVFPEPVEEGAEGEGEAAVEPGEAPAATAAAPAAGAPPQSTEAEVATEEPAVAAAEPAAATEEPAVAVAESDAATEEPAIAPAEPAAAMEEPVVAVAKPEAATEEPAIAPAEPAAAMEEPAIAVAEPEAATEEPAIAPAEPAAAAEEPAVAETSAKSRRATKLAAPEGTSESSKDADGVTEVESQDASKADDDAAHEEKE